MDALDLVEKELAEIEEKKIIQQKYLKKNEKKNEKKEDKNSKTEIVSKNPVLLGLSPYKYFARCLRQIKAPDLDQVYIYILSLLLFSHITIMYYIYAYLIRPFWLNLNVKGGHIESIFCNALTYCNFT
jgi:hypothetical protein